MATFLANVLTSDPAITIYSIIVIILLGYIVRKFPGIKVSVKQPRTLFNVGINKVLHQQHFLPCYTAF